MFMIFNKLNSAKNSAKRLKYSRGHMEYFLDSILFNVLLKKNGCQMLQEILKNVKEKIDFNFQKKAY